jgi:hypothetical protein
MKTRTLLVAAVMLLSFTAAAYAQATFTVGSIPVTAVVRSGNAEKTGDITFSIVSTNAGTSNTGTITISYGVPITSPSANITVSSTFATLNSVSYSGGTVVLNVANTGVVGSTITLSGVRVAVAGTSLTTLDASISAVANAVTAGQTTVRVINAISAGLASISFPTDGTAAQINAVSGAVTSGAKYTGATAGANIRVRENFLNAFGTTVDATQTQPPIIRLTLNQLPPAGVSISFPLVAGNDNSTTSAWQLCSGDSPYTLATADATIKSDSTSLAVYYRLATGSDYTIQERMVVPVSVAVDTGKASFPLPSTSFTLTATLYPIAAAFNSDGTLTSLPIPRYVAEEVGPITFLDIVGSNTAMIFPYMTASKATGYDTGIAIANTTTDPGSSKLGVSGATKQSGTISFYFYPSMPVGGTTVPTTITYTTKAGSPGSGLDSTGNLPSGSTYIVLASQLLKDAGITTDFSGYMIAVANFSNGHAQYFVSNFLTFSQGGQALILTGSRKATPEALNN